MPEYVLGIDTSNYTTSGALLSEGQVQQSKMPLPVKEGERGIRQSDAVFHHVRQLPLVLAPLLERSAGKISSIGVSVSPRSAPDSYMPCFLAGKSCAQTLAAALRVPLVCFSHQQGHLAAALYSAGKLELLSKPFLAFHVSGGTTEALLVTPDQQGMPQTRLAACSLDLKAGQAVDRVGLMLGFSFPCGPAMEQEALKWNGKVLYRPAMKGSDCSLSGIENKCAAMCREGRAPAEIARFCLEAICLSLAAMCRELQKEYGPLPVLFSGGVCSNSLLREKLTEEFHGYFAAPEFSSDNAAGAAVLAERRQRACKS